MNNYKKYTPSPYRNSPKKTEPVPRSKMSLNESIQSRLGKYSFEIEIDQDVETINTLQIPGLVAFISKLYMNGKLVGIGRSQCLITQTFKVVQRITDIAFSGAIIDSVIRSAKYIENMDLQPKLSSNYSTSELQVKYDEPEQEMATSKQISYLRQLINVNVADDEERERRISALSQYTKQDASEAIEKYKQ